MLSILIRLLLVREGNKTALVVGTPALVLESHKSIALEVSNGDKRLVDWELLIVGTDTVTVGVRVREETGLQYGIG